jgi:hypothetical protein
VKDCGRDAHAHVSICDKKTTPPNNLYFGTFELFQQTHKARRETDVIAYLALLDGDIKQAVTRRLYTTL